MKLNILKYTCIALLFTGVTACMDFDIPSDEFTGGDVALDPTVFKGNADRIDYMKEITQEGFAYARGELEPLLSMMTTAQFYIRGGKNGVMPQEHQYQYVYNLHIDNYAGYFTASQNWNGNLPSTYFYSREYCDGPYGSFLSVKNNIANLINHPHVDSIPEIKAIGLLLFDYSAQEMTDIYGSIPYFDHKNNKESNPFEFNKAEEIYTVIIDNLDTINACLKHFEERPQWYKDEIADILMWNDGITMDKSIDSWRRMANSLKLRMAMHCVKPLPAQAQKWAEEAVQEGVVESIDQEIALNAMTGCFYHPLLTISRSWNDTRLNASFESLLFSLNHPLLNYFFTKNIDAITNVYTGEVLPAESRIVGLRAGLEMTSGQTTVVNPRCAYSTLAEEYIMDAPLYYVKVSEMDFLRAEGAIRGWNMNGDARFFYERGIRNAQVETRYDEERQIYSRYVEEYMQKEQATPYTYIDPMDADNNMESVTKIGVKWNDGDNLETKLEKIITQKYLAGYPYANEAWTDLRRTGYPKLFPVIDASEFSDGSLNDGDIIRRIPLPGRDTSNGLDDIYNSGISALGGSDVQGTRIWWDIDSPNF